MIYVNYVSIWSFLKQWENFTRGGRIIHLDLGSV